MKKMNKILLMSTMASLLSAGTVFAGVEGTWYASPHGYDVNLTLEEDGSYVRNIDDEEEIGTWEEKDKQVVIDSGKDIEMTFDIDGEQLKSGDYVFEREKAEKEEASETSEGNIEGSWNASLITCGKIKAKPSDFGLEDFSINIEKDNVKMHAKLGEREIEKKALKRDGEAFEIDLVGDKVCKASCKRFDDKLEVAFDAEGVEIVVEFDAAE